MAVYCGLERVGGEVAGGIISGVGEGLYYGGEAGAALGAIDCEGGDGSLVVAAEGLVAEDHGVRIVARWKGDGEKWRGLPVCYGHGRICVRVGEVKEAVYEDGLPRKIEVKWGKSGGSLCVYVGKRWK